MAYNMAELRMKWASRAAANPQESRLGAAIITSYITSTPLLGYNMKSAIHYLVNTF